MSTLISVIIPTYNRPELLTRAIESVLAQRDHNIEIVVQDDASSESTAAAVEKIARKNIRYFRQEKNVGIAMNWRDGLLNAKGEYILFLMDDDYYSKPIAPTNFEQLAAEKIDLIFSGYSKVDEAGKLISTINPQIAENSYCSIETMLDCFFIARNTFIGTLLIRRDKALSAIDFAVKYNLVIDKSLQLHLLLAEPCRSYFHSTAGLNQSNHPGQTSNTRTLEVYTNMQKLLEDASVLFPKFKSFFDKGKVVIFTYQAAYHSRGGRPLNTIHALVKAAAIGTSWQEHHRRWLFVLFNSLKTRFIRQNTHIAS